MQGISKTLYSWAKESPLFCYLVGITKNTTINNSELDLPENIRNELQMSFSEKKNDDSYFGTQKLLKRIWCAHPEMGIMPDYDSLGKLQYGNFHYKYRDHFEHMLKVLLLGLFLYEESDELRNAFSSMPPEDFVLTWALTALFHDMGYFAETTEGAIDSLEMKSFFEKCSGRMRTPLSTLYGGNGFSEENEKVWINKHSVFLPPTVNYYDVVNNICFSMLKKCNDAFYTDSDMQGLAIKEYYDVVSTFRNNSRHYYDHGIMSALLLLYSRETIDKYVEELTSKAQASLNGEQMEILERHRSQRRVYKDRAIVAAEAIALHNVISNGWPTDVLAGFAAKGIDITHFKIEQAIMPFAHLLRLVDEMQCWSRQYFSAPLNGERRASVSESQIDLFVKERQIYMYAERKENYDKIANALNGILVPDFSIIIKYSDSPNAPKPKNKKESICIRIQERLQVRDNYPKGENLDNELLGDIIANGDLYATLAQLLDDAWTRNEQRHVFLEAEGGFGKTTNLMATANQYCIAGIPAIYIPCNQIDNYTENEEAYYIRRAIMRDMDESGDVTNIENDIIIKIMGRERFIVLLDGLNESAKGAQLIKQIKQLDDSMRLSGMQIIVSGRYCPPELSNDRFMKATIKRLDAAEILQRRNLYDKYETLEPKLKNLLCIPMFLRLFIDGCKEGADSVPQSAAELLDVNHTRTIKKVREIYDEPAETLLQYALPAFKFECCMHKMSAKYEELITFSQKYVNPICRSFGQSSETRSLLGILRTASDIVQSDTITISFRHEHIRDFLVALHVKNKLAASDICADQICGVFNKGNALNLFVQRFAAELLGRRQLQKLLGLLKGLRGHIYQIAVAEIIDLQKIVQDMVIGQSLFDLDLRQASFNGVRFKGGISFKNSVIYGKSFLPSGHSSAPAALLYSPDYGVITISRSEIIRSSEQLEMIARTEIEDVSVPVSSAIIGNVIVAVMANSHIMAWRLEEGLNKPILIEDINAISVVAHEEENRFLVGFKDGQFNCYDAESLELQDSFQVDTDSIEGEALPVYCESLDVLVYYTSNMLIRYDVSTNTKNIIFSVERAFSDQVATINHVVYNDENDCYLAAVEKDHKIEIGCIELNGIWKKIDTLSELGSSKEGTNALFSMKCHDMYFVNNRGIIAYQDKIQIYHFIGSGEWKKVGDPIKITTRNFEVYCSCFINDGIICCVSDRSVKKLTFDPIDSSNNGLIKETLKGHNDGLHSLHWISNNRIFATMYDSGCIDLRRDEKGVFSVGKKIWMDDAWCWDLERIDSNTFAFAVGNCVYIHHDIDLKRAPELLADIGFKIEDMLFSNGTLYIAAGSKVYLYQYLNGELIGNGILTENDNRRALSLTVNPINNDIYVGYSSTKKVRSDQEDGNENSIIEVITPNCTKRVAAKWHYKDGWFSHLDFSKDGKYLLCSGLREITEVGVRQIAVIFDTRGASLKLLAKLVGHTKDVSNAHFYEPSQDEFSAIITCAYDGFIHVYSADFERIRSDSPEEILPLRRSERVSEKLFDIAFDGEDILATCLDGSLFRWKKFKDMDSSRALVTDYKNICGLWTCGCHFESISSESDLGGTYKALKSLGNRMREENL